MCVGMISPMANNITEFGITHLTHFGTLAKFFGYSTYRYQSSHECYMVDTPQQLEGPPEHYMYLCEQDKHLRAQQACLEMERRQLAEQQGRIR